MTRTRIHNLSISLDGFATGEGQAPDAPFGHAGNRLHEWMFATRFGAPILGRKGGTDGVDDAWLAGDQTYYSGAIKRDLTRPRWLIVTHFFNHQTHHRGQVHCMLTQAGRNPHDTDLPLTPE